LGLRRRIGVENDFAGPQSRDFKRYTDKPQNKGKK